MSDMMKDLQSKVKSDKEINSFYGQKSAGKGQSGANKPSTPKKEIGRQTASKANKFKAKSPAKASQAKSQVKANKTAKFKSGYQAPKTASKGQSKTKGMTR